MNRLLLSFFCFFICSFAASAQVDTAIGISAPKCKDYHQLAHNLCDELPAEKDKANAIYNWITHNIKYDVKALKKKKQVTERKAEKALKNRKAVCEGYAMLITAMCREAGLNAVNIEGYAKDWIFDNGDKLYIPRHMWCAVMMNGQWWQTDPTWGAGGLVQSPGIWRRMLNKLLRQQVGYAKKIKFKYKYDTTYFMQDPEAFRLRHLPIDPLWQLTDSSMPIALFEAGDSAVKNFNEHYSMNRQNDPELTRISQLDEKQKLFEFADRAYKYNSRFPVVLAIKQTYRAEAQVIKAFTDSTVQNGMLLIKDAEDGLRKSQVYIKDQKKSFPEQYAQLKKKNTVKNQESKQYIREIRTDNKRLVGESKKYTRAALNKNKRVKSKNTAANKRRSSLDPQKLSETDPAKMQKKTDAPELKDIRDSVAARNGRIILMKLELTIKAEQLHIWQQANSARLDSLASYLGLTDSILVREAISRINLHDIYDDEVIALSGAFKNLKYKKADTLQKYYLAGYDTITTLHERRQKLQSVEMDLYKQNLRSLEQYAKWNNSDTNVFVTYAAAVADYTGCIDFYNKDLQAYQAYVQGNKKLFAYLGKLGRRQIKISDYMDKVEERRKKLEANTIAENKAFDSRENDRQQMAVKSLLVQLEKISKGESN
jgi:hypothetical protein